jgi:cytochrome c551/c552
MERYMRYIAVILFALITVACHNGPEALSAQESLKEREKDMTQLADINGCFACHAIDHHVLGPPWKTVAKRYKGDKNARAYLINKVKKGGSGVWDDLTGGVPMPPYSPRVKDEHIEKLVDYILSLDTQ